MLPLEVYIFEASLLDLGREVCQCSDEGLEELAVDLDYYCRIVESIAGCLDYQGRLIYLIRTDQHLLDLLRQQILLNFRV